VAEEITSIYILSYTLVTYFLNVIFRVAALLGRKADARYITLRKIVTTV
jgi:hypothetical protein